MVVVAGTALLQQGVRGQAEKLIEEVERLTRPESGCISYTFYFAAENADMLHVFEEWESEDALNAHLQRDHTQHFLAGIGALVAAPPDIKRYQVARVTPL